ncbi:MAG: trigger factor [Gammaproteobacteria bacterium]|nr:trigger factor [Gammaproteobacteria bacterium]
MQVTVETTSKLGRKMVVEVPAESIDSEVEKRLKSMSKQVKLHGFRPGKVPLKLVKQRFGSQVQQEVLTEVLHSSYQEAVTQENLRPAGGPSIEPNVMGLGKGLMYTATFEVFPEIEIGDLESMEITKPVAEINKADIDQLIETLRKQRRTWKEVERSSQTGDQIVVDFDGKIDGDAFEGGKGQDVAVELGAGQMLENFEGQLEGVAAGEKKTLDVIFPKDYPQEKLAGENASFEVEVKTVSEPVLPNIDDELAMSFGVKQGGVSALRDEIRKNMGRELEQKTKLWIKEQVMDGLHKFNQVELPEAMVKEDIVRAREQMMKNTGMTDASKFPDKLFEEDARKRVALWLLVSEIVKTQDIKPDQYRVQQMLEEFAASYEDPQQIIGQYRGDKQAMAKVESMVIEEQVVDWVLSKARVKQEDMTFDQVMNSSSAEKKT